MPGYKCKAQDQLQVSPHTFPSIIVLTFFAITVRSKVCKRSDMTSTNLPESNTSLTYTQPSTPPHLTHAPISAPGPQEILVKIKAAAINPVDIQLWGNPVIGWLAGKKEKGIGRDYSGEIVAIGEALKKDGKWEVGDEVYGLCSRPVSMI